MKQKKYGWVIISNFVLMSILNGQNVQLEGEVRHHNQPISYATVWLEIAQRGTVTDENGRFVLKNLKKGSEEELKISALGYQTWRQRVPIGRDSIQDLGVIQLKEDIFGFDEVVVTGTMKETFVSHSPVKVEVITAKFLEKTTSPVNLTEAIRLINGVSEEVACGVCFTNSISINGLPGPYTAVLVDGMPMYGNLAAVYGLNGIPRSMVERIEVTKGPNSTLYGAEAMAGVINVLTKSPEQQPIFSIDLMGSSHEELFADVAFSPKIGRWDGLVGLNWAYMNHWQDANLDGFNDQINLDRLGLFTKWSERRKDGKKSVVAAKLYYEDRRNGVFPFLENRAYQVLRGDSAIYGESIYTQRAEIFGTYELPVSLPLRVDFAFSHHEQDSYYGATFYDAKQVVGFSNFIWNKKIQHHDLMAGLTVRYQSYDDNTVATQDSTDANLPDNQWIVGGFVQEEWKPSDRWTVLGGFRLDYYQRHGVIPAPRLSLRFKPSTWATLRLNLGTGFRIVHLFTEDHAFVTGSRKVEILETLQPERSYNATFNWNQTLGWRQGRGTFDMDVFFTHFTNTIAPDYDQPNKIIYKNLEGFAQTKGVNISVSQVFDAFPLSFNLGATFQRATRTERDGQGIFQTEKMEFAPDWSAVGAVNFDWKQANINFSYSFNLTGKMQLPSVYDLDPQGVPLPEPRPNVSSPFGLHNFQILKTFAKTGWQLYVGVQNLTDYRQAVSPLSGFNDPNNPAGFSPFFDTSYNFAPIHGREFYIGFRLSVKNR